MVQCSDITGLPGALTDGGPQPAGGVLGTDGGQRGGAWGPPQTGVKSHLHTSYCHSVFWVKPFSPKKLPTLVFCTVAETHTLAVVHCSLLCLQVCGWSDQQGEDPHLREDAVESVPWERLPEEGRDRGPSGGPHHCEDHQKEDVLCL